MCIVQAGKRQPVHVSDTNIFVCEKPRKDPAALPEQLTIYANTVGFEREPVAMILPMPATSEHGCEMVNVKNIDVFTPLRTHFEPKRPKARSVVKGARSAPESQTKKLEIRRCGAYRYSVVPTLEDFHRLEDHVFKIQDQIFTLLQRHYNIDFSFLVCIIDNAGANQPVAYVHPLRDGKLFIPTRHEHGDQSHGPTKSHRGRNGLPKPPVWKPFREEYRIGKDGQKRTVEPMEESSERDDSNDQQVDETAQLNGDEKELVTSEESESDADDSHNAAQPAPKKSKSDKADWDHAIYILNTTPPPKQGVLHRANIMPAPQDFISLPFDWGPLLKYVPAPVNKQLFHKIVMRGDHPNDDIWVEVATRKLADEPVVGPGGLLKKLACWG
ncbi:uncharacterized protein EV422DRAFT_380965 [Fimicolochytrium jonesii]|uniref:uncharacterized protein n=1 Tax=Fimicolochytrium jonesii TaxID=1396493 RepID=UPI0022FEE5F9|nr:uncharacterized protein EV422DRAFT_380965 [Fimicolochytrium jonesii]KAI8822846.1 hypothetical protein EV422DRAFT_380965 [Fimicolochytrium jonesii]